MFGFFVVVVLSASLSLLQFGFNRDARSQSHLDRVIGQRFLVCNYIVIFKTCAQRTRWRAAEELRDEHISPGNWNTKHKKPPIIKFNVIPCIIDLYAYISYQPIYKILTYLYVYVVSIIPLSFNRFLYIHLPQICLCRGGSTTSLLPIHKTSVLCASSGSHTTTQNIFTQHKSTLWTIRIICMYASRV